MLVLHIVSYFDLVLIGDKILVAVYIFSALSKLVNLNLLSPQWLLRFPLDDMTDHYLSSSSLACYRYNK